MKKMYLSLLTAIAISGLVTSQAKADVYKGDVYPVLKNNYSADVEYIERGRGCRKLYQTDVLSCKDTCQWKRSQTDKFLLS